jgi:hypothetical protein
MALGLTETTCENADVKPNLRQILAESHISAVAIAVLLLWSMVFAFRALLVPSLQVTEYLFTAAAIRAIPFASPFTSADRVMLFVRIEYLFNTLANFSAAWLLARWVYGEGPLRCFGRYRARVWRGNA